MVKQRTVMAPAARRWLAAISPVLRRPVSSDDREADRRERCFCRKLPPLPRPPQVIDDKREVIGAGNEARTRDLNLGKVALYQLSYSRPKQRRNCRAVPPGVKKNPVRNTAKALNYPAILPYIDAPRANAPRARP